jgi:hypothetical protein
MAMTIEEIDAEIAGLLAEILNTEHMPPTIAERYAKVEAELRQAEQLYRAHGVNASAGHPAEHAHVQRQSLIGAMMVTGGDKMLKAERARLEAQGEGMTAADKERRLDQLRLAILKAAAQRELMLREVEREGEFQPRPSVHAEMVVWKRGDLEQLANSK